MYKDEYPGPQNSSGHGSNDPYVSIDLHAIGAKIGMSPELIFGRLYFHLDQKYRYKQEHGASVSLFQLQIEGKRHAVQFPYLASILAEKNQEFRRYVVGLAVSFLALGVSVTALLVSILKR